MNIGLGEILTFVFIVVVVFSASRMGSLGNALGKFVYSFKKAAKGEGFVDVTKLDKGRKRTDAEDAQVVEDPRDKRR